MAAGFAITSEGGQYYNGKMTAFVVLSCIVAATGGLIFGYDIGISGGVTSMEPFLKKFFPEVYRKMKEDTNISNYCRFDSQLLTTFTSSLYIAGLIASLFASSVTRAFGRKASILVGGTAFLAGSALGGAAFNIYMLIFGRVLLGVGIGFANQSVPLYLSEMAPPKNRGAFNIGFQVCVAIGVLSANLLNYGTQKIKGGWGWRISLAMAAAPASILTIGALFLPETPNSIIQRSNDHQKAERMLQRVRGTADVQAELDDLIRAGSISKTINHPFKKIIERKYRPQLVMAILIPFFQQVTGINVISFYAPVLFRTIKLSESTSLLMSAIVTGGVGTISTILSMILADRLGRKVLFLVGGIQMLVSQVMIGSIMAAQLGDHGGFSSGYAYLILVLVCVYTTGFAYSWGPLGWLVPSEIFPLEIRSAGQSITVAVGLLFTFLVAQTFLAMLCHFKAGIFFFFGGWVAFMTTFVHFFLPETKNLPIEQMDKLWVEHWFWRRIVGEGVEDSKIQEAL
ncbi:MFS domain-containing protein [Citrus sinensis]|uniref:MFS domain-containing protein n=1 Tax=Citrus sinensis TaxID=2711 RepID=A0ACB8HUY0_CITSI|nr:MFS domain-containing protein [Citrus sinensis]